MTASSLSSDWRGVVCVFHRQVAEAPQVQPVATPLLVPHDADQGVIAGDAARDGQSALS